MLTPAEAEQLIERHVVPFPREQCPLGAAHGRVLREPVRADRDLPPFDRVTMDGYALRTVDFPANNGFRLVGESAAGHGYAGTLKPGEVVRIFTGAPVPEGADAVLLQENATVDGHTIHNYVEAMEAIDELQSELDGGEISNCQRMLFRDFIDQLRYILATE